MKSRLQMLSRVLSGTKIQGRQYSERYRDCLRGSRAQVNASVVYRFGVGRVPLVHLHLLFIRKYQISEIQTPSKQ